MSEITRAVREIIQEHAGNNDISTLQGLYTVANATLFPQDALNVIDNRFRQNLVLGVTLHYFNDEICMETLPLWKYSLSDVLYNYGGYINEIYDSLDKQLFADYRVRNVSTQGTNNVSRTGEGTVTDEKEEENTTSTRDNTTRTENGEIGEVGTLAGTGTIANAKTGSDTIAHTGTDRNAKSGYDTLEQTGTNTQAHTGTQETEGTNTQETNNTGTTGTDVNAINISYDTPQGSLDNMRLPGGNAKGTGVAYANGQTYNYMSAAGENDQSTVQTDNTTQNVEGTDNSTITYDETHQDTRNLTDETTYNSETNRTVNLSDATTFNSTNTETRNTLDTNNKTTTSEKSATDVKTGSTTGNVTSTNTQTRDTVDTEEGRHSDTTAETDYTLNYEMVYKSMPYLRKIWDIFDDLFIHIYPMGIN